MQFNRTKIIATVGPACNDKETLKALILAGVNIFRLNFSHGEHDDHKKVIERVNELNDELNTHTGFLADLQGPKLRIGIIKEGKVQLKEGQELVMTTAECEGTAKKVHMTYEDFPKDVKAGDTVLVDDGKIHLKVIETDGKENVRTEVIYGGPLSSRKGVNLPDTKLSIPSLTEKDIRDLEFALAHQLHWVALSFVRSAADIKELKRITNNPSVFTKIIAKIEKPEALEAIDEIIAESDGIMIARGDLGIEIPMEETPLWQKSIINKCIQKAKPVILATQIMESMIESPSPTRAEVTDVANAVIDGADALMLSAETAAGKYPVKVVETMTKIITNVESKDSIYHKNLLPYPDSKTFLSDAICYNACKMSHDVNGAAIIGMTRSGYTAFMMSSYRPKAGIYIFTDNRPMLKTLSLVWGVRAFYYFNFVSTDDSIKDVQDILVEKGILKTGDVAINAASMPLSEMARTNMVKISKVK